MFVLDNILCMNVNQSLKEYNSLLAWKILYECEIEISIDCVCILVQVVFYIDKSSVRLLNSCETNVGRSTKLDPFKEIKVY